MGYSAGPRLCWLSHADRLRRRDGKIVGGFYPDEASNMQGLAILLIQIGDGGGDGIGNRGWVSALRGDLGQPGRWRGLRDDLKLRRQRVMFAEQKPCDGINPGNIGAPLGHRV